MSLVRRVLTHPFPALLFRVYVGGVFVYASMNKISYTGEFAETIASYQIVPYWAVNLMAVWLPWLELLCGILLAVGFRVRAMAMTIALLLCVFCLAIAINLVRGTPIGCGCFSSLEDDMSLMTLVRDLVWLAMVIHVFFFDKLLQLEKTFTPKIKDLPA